MNTVALLIGWVVIGVAAIVAVSWLWWAAGDLIWRALPESWRTAQWRPVPQPRYGNYVPPAVSGKALALMFVLGGPWGWLRFPRMLRTNRTKRRMGAKPNPDKEEAR